MNPVQTGSVQAPATHEHHVRWQVNATPLAWVWTVVVLGLLFLACQTWLATRVPTLGVELSALGDNAGLAVERVYSGLPAADAGLTPGDVIVALSGDADSVTLHDYLTLQDPDVAGSYAVLAAFQRDAMRLHRLLADGPVQLHLADGSSLPVTAQPQRPLRMLPFWYWALSVMGIIALAIGVALKAHTPGDSNTMLVMVAALGFWLTAWSWPLYGARELTAPLAAWVSVLENINHLGFVIMIGAAVGLLWQYPVKLGPGKLWPATIGFGLLIWSVMTLRLYEFLVHAFYFPLFCMPLVVAIAFAVAQWHRSRNRPLEKASLRWLLITMFGSTCGAFAMYVVPPMYGWEPLTPPWASQLILLIFFLGLALGAARYRLFEVERWWVNTWLWFGMGVLIITIDVALISFLQLGAAGSTVLAVLIVAWVYFPLRQRIWEFLAPARDESPWQVMPLIASRFARPLRSSQVVVELGSLLESIFDAPDPVILHSRARSDAPRLTQHGLNLLVPAPHGTGQVLLSGKHRGRQLFSLSDVEYAQTVTGLVAQLVELAQEHEGVERTERERIMRDLHDDVGARLLSLVHGSHDPAVRDEASDLLQTLRTSVIPLHSRQAISLPEAAAKWRTELEQRTSRAGAQLHWRDESSATAHLSARQYVNITRILRELVTNALKHAGPASVWIALNASRRVEISLIHDGQISAPGQWTAGRGQHNLENRAAEIDASLEYAVLEEPSGARLMARLRLEL